MPSTLRRLARRLLPDEARRAAVRFSGGRLAAEDGRETPSRAPSEAVAGPRRPVPPADAAEPTAVADPLLTTLRHGSSLVEAVVQEVRALLDGGEHALATAVASSLQNHDDTASLGDLAAGIIAQRRGYPARAWSLLGPLPADLWAIHAPDEFTRSGLATDAPAAVRALSEVMSSRPAAVSGDAWLAMLGPVFGHGDAELARSLFAVLDDVVGDGHGADPDLVVNRDWLRPWVARSADGATAPAPPDGRVPFAIIDYGHPGRSRASANIGDHVQSIAAMSHLVRHQSVGFSGPQDLVDLAHQLQGRVRAERRLDDVVGEVELLTVDRDASTYVAIPQDTWALAFGWYMHPLFETRYDFPLHRNLRPIFVSFHCSKRELLTPDAIAYLATYAPIGCRDWTTVDVLLSVGVPAFFSGCLTTTVSTVFPDTPERPAADAAVAYVDVPADRVPAGAPTYAHSDDAIRFRSFAANMYDALDLLETYRREHPGLVTSRLHCYLPARSLGVPVDFQPGNRSDPRFAGLIDITDAEFDRIRNTINDKLRAVLSAAFAGGAPDEVYALWRELNAPDVEEARRRHSRAARLPAARVDLTSEIERIGVHHAGGEPDTVHVAVHVPPGRQRQVEVLLSSVVRYTDRPVHAWLLSRRPGTLDRGVLRRAVPEASFRIIDTSGLGASLRRPDGTRPANRDVDLLALPGLLPDVDRLVVLPVDALVLGDVAALADLELDGHGFAAPTVVGSRGASGFGLLHAAAGRLAGRTAASAELRRQGHARHVFDFDAFDTDVLVLDLAELRAGHFVETYVPYVEEFGLSFREILHFDAGPHRTVLPERWHVVPTRSAEPSPLLLHWAGAGKPWTADVAPEQARWFAMAARVGDHLSTQDDEGRVD